jgi:GT2 family glycosyltransferase
MTDDDIYSVELVLSDGSSRSSKVLAKRCTPPEFKEELARVLKGLNVLEGRLPDNSSYIKQLLRPQASTKPVLPRHNIELINGSDDGAIFIVGWIDDTVEELDKIYVTGANWCVTFTADGLARIARDDVQESLNIARRHAFGFWGFASTGVEHDGTGTCDVLIVMKNGSKQRLEVPFRIMTQIDLRNLVLLYLASSKYLGNPQLDSVASIDKAIGAQLIEFNLRISKQIVAHPHVEKFEAHRSRKKASIVVCLYGKAEFLFLQSALYAKRPGIDDYEFIYVSNSPELSERLLRDARMSAKIYGLDLTVVLLPNNAGFGAANNAAVRFAGSDRVLIVNPDVFPLDDDWAAKHTEIVEGLRAEQTKLFGVPLYYDDGSLMHGGMYFDSDIGVSVGETGFERNAILRVEHYGKGAPPLTDQFLKPRPVPAITGAFMSCDRAWFEKLGGFGEEYVFGHYEDADLCLKSIRNGIAPWMHNIKLWHLEGKGSTRLPTHEGGSIVNRWLFTKRWSKMLDPELVGQSPRHPLISGVRTALKSADTIVGASTRVPSSPPSGRRTPGRARQELPPESTHRLTSQTEIIFRADD